MKFVSKKYGELNESKPFEFWASEDGHRIYVSGYWGPTNIFSSERFVSEDENYGAISALIEVLLP